MMRREINTTAGNSSGDEPKRISAAANKHAVTSSAAGYIKEILCPQLLHLPLWKRNDRMGINSAAVNVRRQNEHAERGVIMDICTGIRHPAV